MMSICVYGSQNADRGYREGEVKQCLNREKVNNYYAQTMMMLDDHYYFTHSTTHSLFTSLYTPTVDMSENEPEISDAEKIRLKRLARLGGPTRAAQTPTSTPSTTDQPTESPQAQPGPSASSRLLNSIIPSQATQLPKETPASKPTTSTAPAARPIKRPSPPSAQPEPAAAPRTRKPTAPSPLPVPYPEWEAQRIQTIFSVTLSVSLKSTTRADDSEETPKGVIGHYAGSRSCRMRSSLKGLVSLSLWVYLIIRRKHQNIHSSCRQTPDSEIIT
jgi:hypothetical protein